MQFTPRDYQTEAVDSTMNYLRKAKGSPLIELPTGSGKSLVQAMLCQKVAGWGKRAIILQPSRELTEQNVAKLKALAPELSVGIYSASLRSKQSEADFVYATIGSVVDKECELGERSMVIVDECHLIPRGDGGQYNKFLRQLKALNPKARMIGMTATPYRLDNGSIIGTGLPFEGVSYRLPVGRLLDEGHLAPLLSKNVLGVDTSGLRRSGWDFKGSDLSDLFMGNVRESVRETVAIASSEGRKSCLVFCSGVDHAAAVARYIEWELTGEKVGVVTGDTLPLERAQLIADFRSGRLRWLVNCNVLTTGFDAPNVDLISVMRATLSAGLFSQICGRGLRTSPGKTDCILLDFGGNVKRHGAIDDPDYGNKPKPEAGKGEAVMKVCPCCGSQAYAASRECGCGYQFPAPQINVDSSADSVNDVMNATAKNPWTEVKVAEAKYFRHSKEGKPDSLRVIYKAEGKEGQLFAPEYSEWLCIEHEGVARDMAEAKWNKLSRNHCPDTVYEALTLADAGALAVPDKILVKQDGKYWRLKLPRTVKRPPFIELPDLEAPF